MFHVFEFIKFGGHEEIYLIVLIVVFAAIFIFEKNPKPQDESEKYEVQDEYGKKEYEDEKYEGGEYEEEKNMNV